MSSDATPRMGLAILPPTPAQPQVTHNEALHQIDALTDICLLGKFVNAPPASPSDGDTYLLGGAPTGAWSGQAWKLAYCLDGGWRFFAPFNGLRAYVAASNAFLVYQGSAWIDATALISASEVSIASAATCDLGAAGSLFVAVTGTTAITSLGTGVNLLRHVRFAGALILTHNAASLVLTSGATRVTGAGDNAAYVSDASGNWRELFYQRASLAAQAAEIQSAFTALTVTQNAGSISLYARRTNGVGTSATAIGDPSLGEVFAMVSGADSGSNRFQDTLKWSYSNFKVVDSLNIYGTPTARTYTLAGDTLRLQMASGSYDVQVSGWRTPETH
jgi:hypothetical protein